FALRAKAAANAASTYSLRLDGSARMTSCSPSVTLQSSSSCRKSSTRSIAARFDIGESPVRGRVESVVESVGGCVDATQVVQVGDRPPGLIDDVQIETGRDMSLALGQHCGPFAVRIDDGGVATEPAAVDLPEVVRRDQIAPVFQGAGTGEQ